MTSCASAARSAVATAEDSTSSAFPAGGSCLNNSRSILIGAFATSARLTASLGRESTSCGPAGLATRTDA